MDSIVWDGLKKKRVGTCPMCGKHFLSTRSDAKTCSGKCRKQASRAGLKLQFDNFVSVGMGQGVTLDYLEWLSMVMGQ